MGKGSGWIAVRYCVRGFVGPIWCLRFSTAVRAASIDLSVIALVTISRFFWSSPIRILRSLSMATLQVQTW